MKKIAIIGAHGVGKTTLCKMIADHAIAQHARSVKVIGEVARACPFPINNGMCYDSAEWIILTQILKEKESAFEKRVTNSKHRKPSSIDLLICDRSSYDPQIYFRILNTKPFRSNKVFALAMSHLWTYDYFVYVSPSGKVIEDDGIRDTSMQLQYKIHREFIRDIETLPAINKKMMKITSDDIFSPFSPQLLEEIYSCIF
jgi:nicotinamide riboside kinase